MHLLFRQWFLSVEEGYNVLSLTMYSAKSQQGFLFLDGAAYMFIFNKELYPATWYGLHFETVLADTPVRTFASFFTGITFVHQWMSGKSPLTLCWMEHYFMMT